MRVLVTGASGFIGSHAVAALREAGHECLLMVRNPEKARAVFKVPGVLYEADIRDAEAVRHALEQCDAVLHAAADMGLTGRDVDLHGANVRGLKNVLGQAVDLGLDPVVHLSTVAVFVPPGEPVITVDSPLARPRNAYGMTKLYGERYARDLEGVTIVYPGGVVGPGQPTLDGLNEGFRAGLRRGWPIVPGGVSVLDVRDLAVALARCFTPGRGARRYLLGGHFLTWEQVATLCEDVTGRRVRRFRMPGALLRTLGATLDGLRRVVPVDHPLARDAADYMLTLVPTDDVPTLRELGITLRPVENTVADTVRWLVAEGHLTS
ncbi:NAD-dependent epimerase/dehydratase family protein [Nonomuraea sp. NPDC059194]|uniref:NAD-dependent epimerase/dehydratase family protein n=1 Tax=Nonomuraea sp. NPDC059194 TaxID=3346764 RepID=UPI00368C65C3